MRFNIFDRLGLNPKKWYESGEDYNSLGDLLSDYNGVFGETMSSASSGQGYDVSRGVSHSAIKVASNFPTNDHNNDGHFDNGRGNGKDVSDFGKDKVKIDHSVKVKGDHNDDGHPDNGKGGGKDKGDTTDEPVDTPPVDTPDEPVDTGPITLFTLNNDTVDFNAFDAPPDVADTNDGMHDALSGDDIVYLPETQAAADAVGYDTSIAFNGGDGDDTIYGGDTDDIIRTGVDRNPDASYDYDSHSSGSGSDVVYGGGGDDTIIGDRGADELHGGDGNDSIWANGDAWLTTAGDKIYGDAGNDILRGSYGDDEIYGGTGNDYLEGQNGNDILDGGDGADKMYGGKGNDTFVQRDGYLNLGDLIYGEEGDDILRFDFATEDDMLDSLDTVRDAVNYVNTQDTSGTWHHSDAGFSMIGVENVEAYVGGSEVDLLNYGIDFVG